MIPVNIFGDCSFVWNPYIQELNKEDKVLFEIWCYYVDMNSIIHMSSDDSVTIAGTVNYWSPAPLPLVSRMAGCADVCLPLKGVGPPAPGWLPLALARVSRVLPGRDVAWYIGCGFG